jgi:AcrR family transcriptional regulator
VCHRNEESGLAFLAHVEAYYDAITVEDLCERANVGRSTFYAHYTGKDDLLRSGLARLREVFIGRQTGAAIAKDKKDCELTFSLAMFQHARNHAHLHRALGNRGTTIALDAIREVLCDLVRSELTAATGKNSPSTLPRELIVQCVVGAHMGVVSWWLNGGANLPPEQVAAMFRRLAIEGLARSYR